MKKNILSAVVLLVLICGCRGGAQKIQNASVATVRSDIKRIAVIDFEFDRPERETINMGHVTRPKNAGSIMADIFAEKLLETGMYQLVERKQIKNVMDEHGLSMSGMLENSSLEEVGNILQVEGLVMGNVSDYADAMCGLYWGSTVNYSARLVDIKTGLVVWSVTGHIDIPFGNANTAAQVSADSAVKELLKKMKKAYETK
ncbi:MAG: hypothetical protein JW928_07220 [Candidatus Aureabacteria bacterium]|nr:hypothetical protein [Candidatus Auribacterota bacterium]